MFERLTPQPPDPLLALIGAHHADPRPGKIDLGVGVYRDANGETPVMRAVKTAERRLLDSQASKSYVGPSGDLGFLALIEQMVFGDAAEGRRVAGQQTPGGTGALRLAGDLLVRAGARAIWLGRPTWANHDPVLVGAGLPVREYPYFDVTTQTIDFASMRAALHRASEGDVVLLQAACHNPTGADLSAAQWDEVASIVAERRLLPLIDVAYQGLAVGLDEDMAGARKVLAAAPEAIVAVSMSKNFGLYRERTGAIFVVAASLDSHERAQSNLLAVARANYSMPPDHGAAVVRVILEDQALKRDWLDELAATRARIVGIRRRLAAFGQAAGIDLASFAHQHGMFSILGLSGDCIDRLRTEQAIYMTGFGRINLAGLADKDIERFVSSLGAVVGRRPDPVQQGVGRLAAQASFARGR